MSRHARPLPGRPPAGVTLVELVVALAIASALALLAAPAYGRWMAEQRLMEEARRLAYALTLARSEAIKRNGRVEVCVADAADACSVSGGWQRGYLTFADRDGDADRDPAEPGIAYEPAAPPGVTIVANAPIARYVSFTHSGHARRSDGALQMGTFTVCSPGLAALKVVLANSGRVRIDRTSLPCP